MVPLLINTYVYQEYINIDEESLYENQIKNTTVTLQEEVDLSQSEIYWNNQWMDIIDHSFMVSINQEGENILSYVLRNKEGELLEKDSKKIVLDTQSPCIHVTCNGYEIDTDLYVIDDLLLDIEISDDYLDYYSILLDGDSMDSNHIEIHSTNHELIILATDKAGNQISKNIQIHSMKSIFPELSIVNGEYSLSPLEMTWDNQLDTTVKMYVSGAIDEMKNYSNTSKETYLPKEIGTYQIYYQSETYPYLISDSIQFFYTNEKPSITIHTSSMLTNKEIECEFLRNSDFIKESWISINGKKQDWQDSIKLLGEENKDTIYTLQAYVRDEFGQEAFEESNVRIDKKSPDFEIKANDTLLSNSFQYENIRKLELLTDEDSNIETQYILNGIPIHVQDLASFLNSMNVNDCLISNYWVTDLSGNQTNKSYVWKKIGIIQSVAENSSATILNKEIKDNDSKDEEEKLDIPIVQTKIEDYQNGYIQYRTWTLDENQNVILKDEKKTNTKKSKVYIVADKNLKIGDTIRVVFMKYSSNSKDDIVWIKVNGKKLKGNMWKVDTLGNKYCSLKIHKNTLIEVKVKRESGEIYRYHKNLKVNKQTIKKTKTIMDSIKEIIHQFFYA